jgi:hypothetical protein
VHAEAEAAREALRSEREASTAAAAAAAAETESAYGMVEDTVAKVAAMRLRERAAATAEAAAVDGARVALEQLVAELKIKEEAARLEAVAVAVEVATAEAARDAAEEEVRLTPAFIVPELAEAGRLKGLCLVELKAHEQCCWKVSRSPPLARQKAEGVNETVVSQLSWNRGNVTAGGDQVGGVGGGGCVLRRACPTARCGGHGGENLTSLLQGELREERAQSKKYQARKSSRRYYSTLVTDIPLASQVKELRLEWERTSGVTAESARAEERAHAAGDVERLARQLEAATSQLWEAEQLRQAEQLQLEAVTTQLLETEQLRQAEQLQLETATSQLLETEQLRQAELLRQAGQLEAVSTQLRQAEQLRRAAEAGEPMLQLRATDATAEAAAATRRAEAAEERRSHAEREVEEERARATALAGKRKEAEEAMGKLQVGRWRVGLTHSHAERVREGGCPQVGARVFLAESSASLR